MISNQNYTSDENYLNLTINQAAGDVELYLDGSTTNLTVELGGSVTINMSVLAGENSSIVYLDGNMVANGTATTNTTIISTLGSKNVTAILDSSQNYTRDTQTRWIDVLDTINPEINLTDPLNINYTTIQTALNYTVSDLDLQVCWYSLNEGEVNTTITCGDNVTGLNSGQGSLTWIVYANDSTGNENSSSVVFFVDSINPEINIIFPLNNTNTSNSNIEINYTVLDTNLQTCWWTNSSGNVNHTITCGDNLTAITWDEGINNITIYANDTLNNVNSSSVRFMLDTINPQLNITYPTNGTNTTDTQLDVNYTISDINLQICWWSNSSGEVNHTITCGDNLTTITWDEGINTINLWANDSVNNVNDSELISFTVDSIAPTFTNLENKTTGANQSFIYDIDATDSGVGVDCFTVDDTTNFTMNCSGYLKNNTLFDSLIIYYLNITVNDSFGNLNSEVIFINITGDSSYPVFSNFQENPANNTVYVSGTNYEFNSTVINTNGTIILVFNGVEYLATNVSGNEFNTTVSDLGAGTYSYSWTSYGNGTSHNQNTSSTYSYTIAKATASLTFLANGGIENLSLVYPLQVNISAISDYGTVGLDRDGVEDTSNNAMNVSLAAGSYIYRANISGGQNYSDVDYAYYNITLNRTTLTGSLVNNDSWYTKYRTLINITYSETNTGDDDVVYEIYRDGVNKSVEETVALAAGTYSYILNSTGGQNYSEIASIDAQILIVNESSGAPQNEIYPTSAAPLTLVRITADLVSNGSLFEVNATLNVPSGFEFTDTSTYPINQVVGNLTDGQTETAEWRVFTPSTEATYSFNITWRDNESREFQGSNKDIVVSYSAVDLSSSTFVDVSAQTEIEAGNAFTAEIAIRDGNGDYVNADSTPEISLIDPLGDVSVGPTTSGVTNIETGRYNYTKATASSWMGGSWQIFANVTRNSDYYNDRDYFKITSGPFDVRDISITDTSVPTLGASVVLENTGGATKDMYVEWNLTRIDTDVLLDSGADTVAVVGSSTLTHSVTPSTTYVGNVKITFMGWYGTDFTERAGAFKTFTTTSVPSGDTTGGGGSSGGSGGILPEKTFSLDETQMSVKLKQGETKEIEFSVKNTGQISRQIEITSDLEDMMKIEDSFSLSAGESKTVKIDVIAKEDKIPDVYLGKIYVKSGTEIKEILVTVEVTSREYIFDVAVKIPNKYSYVSPGEYIPVSISLTKIADVVADEVTMNYFIKDEKGNVIFSDSEIKIIDESLDLIKGVAIPADIQSGRYLFYVQVEYQGKIASASTWFNVTENKFLVVLRRNIVLISIIVLLLALIIYLIKRKKGKLKIFKSKGKRKRKHIGTLIAPKD